MIQTFFKGLRVIDLTTAYAGPYCTRIMAEMGAEVIKVEAIQRLDMPVRGGCYPENDPGDEPWNQCGYFHMLNAHKYGITLNLANPKGIDIFKRLVSISDVVVENFSPRVMETLGLSYETLRSIKEDIIMVSLSAFGHTGPIRNYVGFAPDMESRAGLVSITAFPNAKPTSSITGYADWCLGRTGFAALATALYQRRRTGQGQYIDVAGSEAILAQLGELVLDCAITGQVPGPIGNRSRYFAPHGCYQCQGEDKWVVIGVDNEEQWTALCEVMGNPAWAQQERFRKGESRWQHHDELDRLIEEWTRQRSPAAAAGLLQRAGVPAGPVLNIKEIMLDQEIIDAGSFEVVSHPGSTGDRPHPRMLAAHFGASTSEAVPQHAPRLGEHNEYVLRGLLGISEEEYGQLERDEVIGTQPKAFPKWEERPLPLDYLIDNHVAFLDTEYLEELTRIYGKRVGPPEGQEPKLVRGRQY